MAQKKKIEELVTPVVENEGFELVEMKLARYKKSSRLQLYVDSDHGVSIDDCIKLTKALEPVLEESGVFAYGYTIEVSSPGLDRPLTTARDFKRRIGERVKIHFNDSAVPPAEGELVSADESCIELKIDDDRSKYDLISIKMGKIIF